MSSISAIATSTTTTATSSTAVPGNPPPLGAIIGGTVGGLAVVSLAVLAVLFFWRRASDSPKAQHSQSEVAASAAVAPGGEGYPKPPPNAPATMPWGVGGVAGAGRDGVHSGVPPSYGSGPSIGSPQSRVGSPVVSDYSEELKGPYQHQQPGSPQQPQPFQQGFQQVYQQQGYQQQGYIPPQPQPQNQGASTRWGMPSEMDSDYRG